jgi:hypothetical protein
MLIAMRGRKTGKLHTVPVNYLRQGDRVLCGCDFKWWRNLEGGAEVLLRIRGQELRGWAEPIRDDPERSRQGFRQLRPYSHRRALRTAAVLVEIRLARAESKP